MSKLVCVFLLVTVASCTNASRIVGGSTTAIERYPAIVQVESRSLLIWSQSCAANILNIRFLLSAAHCFDGIFYNTRNRRIRAGTSNRGSGGTVISLDRVRNHPNYGNLGQDADISLLRLSQTLAYGDAVRPVAIPPQGFNLPDNLPVVNAGWGATSSGPISSSSSILRHVQVYTINNEICAARYGGLLIPHRVTGNMICAGVLNVGGRDACDGDGGGPLYFDNILVGIISWGRSCGSDYYPGVSTKVSSYTNWIVENAV